MPIIDSYSQTEKRLLTAVYYAANRLDKDIVSVEEVLQTFDFPLPERQARTALSAFVERGYSKTSMIFGDLEDQQVWLTADGIIEAERLINSRESDILEFDRARHSGAVLHYSVEAEVVPASDRVVRLDHNLPAYTEVKSSLDELYEQIRADNAVGETPEHRDRLLRSLQAAKWLWEAAELRVVQVKVGIILAIEDAAEALRAVGKMIGVAILVDAIKAVVKACSGIDF